MCVCVCVCVCVRGGGGGEVVIQNTSMVDHSNSVTRSFYSCPLGEPL